MSRRLPEPGLPDRLMNGSASEDDRSWACARLAVLDSNRDAIGLSREEEWELFGLRQLVGEG